MEKDNNVIQLLIAEGAISKALGALITDKSSNTGFIARIAIYASLEAKENASKLNISRIIAKNHSLYEISPDGLETLIKVLPKSSKRIPKTFKLD